MKIASMISCQKHKFSLREGVHYLNCAYKAPLLLSAEQAGMQAMQRSRNPIDISVDDFFNVSEDIRHLFAGIVNCSHDEVALISSTSYGFSSVLNNIKGKRNGHVITIQDEFPSGYYSLEAYAQREGQEMVVVAPPEDGKGSQNELLLDAINEHTSVVLISSVHWMNGYLYDLEAIGKKCQAIGAAFIVDGTQSVGALPIDVKRCGIHALITASYKWLMGPYSMALAYIHPAYHEGRPLEEAWMNRSNAHAFHALTDYVTDYRSGAGRYNCGETSNFILSPILRSALQQITEWTPEAIQNYAQSLNTPLYDYLDGIGVDTDHRSEHAHHLFGLKLPAHIDQAVFKQRLLDNKVYLSVRGASLRVAINVFNDRADIDKLIEVIDSSV